ncbi:MAG: VOC family protein [Clostridiales bacterium]|nr:VOC family protein [Clostridiales bacterium]
MEKYITGLQHIGVPAIDIDASVAFYESLGFKIIYETTLNETARVVYLEANGLVIETFETDTPAGATGSIDHITLDVTDIDAVFELAKEKGYTITDGGGINFLPFWDNGIKYIMLEGPNKERVELTQIL